MPINQFYMNNAALIHLYLHSRLAFCKFSTYIEKRFMIKRLIVFMNSFFIIPKAISKKINVLGISIHRNLSMTTLFDMTICLRYLIET